MQQLFENSPSAKIEKLANNAEFVSLIKIHLDMPTQEATGPLKNLIALIHAEQQNIIARMMSTKDTKARFTVEAESRESNLLRTLDEHAKAVLGEDFSLVSDNSILTQLLSQTVLKILIDLGAARKNQLEKEITDDINRIQAINRLSEKDRQTISTRKAEIAAAQKLIDANPEDRALNAETQKDIAGYQQEIDAIIAAAPQPLSPAPVASLAPAVPAPAVNLTVPPAVAAPRINPSLQAALLAQDSDFAQLIRTSTVKQELLTELQSKTEALNLGFPFGRTLETLPATLQILLHDLETRAKTVLNDSNFSFGNKENLNLLLEAARIIETTAPASSSAPAATVVNPLVPPAVSPAATAASVTGRMIDDLPPLETSTTAPASTTGSTVRVPLVSDAKPARGLLARLFGSAPNAQSASRSSDSLSGIAKTLAGTNKIPATPALFVKHSTMGPHPDYQKLLVAHKNDINAELKRRNLGYKLKEDTSEPRKFYLAGPMKILINAQGEMVAAEEDRKHNDYAKHIANAMEAISIMNQHVGYTYDQFAWAPGEVAADKKAKFDERVAEISRNYSAEAQLDAGDVEISAGPADGTKHSDYKLSAILKNTTYREAIKKAVGTKGYELADDNKSMTRTLSDGTKRKVTLEENGVMKAPRIQLGDAFTSLDSGSKLRVTGDERNRAVIIARLTNELIAMLRFYVTLYIKGGATALPGDSIDFRVAPTGLLTQQAREYQEKIMPEVGKRFMEELGKTQGIMGKKAYYPEKFKELITFNGKPIPGVQPNPAPTPPTPSRP